jgi:serine/threonine protein kinase
LIDLNLKFEKDFGMSRVLEQDIEERTKSRVGPVCWMSPESIGQQVYSKKSGVWMFGMLGMGTCMAPSRGVPG